MRDKAAGMKIEQRDIDRIRPYEKNPRRNDKAVEAVGRSIREAGSSCSTARTQGEERR